MRFFRKRFIVWLNRKGATKLVVTFGLVALILTMFSIKVPTSKSETWSYWTMPLSGKTIALDPGHGGPDGGAVSKSGLVEADINLQIAFYLRDFLQEAGAIVVMTREENKDLARPETKGYSKRKTEDLLQRVELIRKHHADLVVSIHLNAIQSPRWRGAQTFYNPKLEESNRLAALIQDEFIRNLGNTNRATKTDDTFYILKALPLPGALVEAGFLSNPEEAKLLGSPDYQKKIAASIYQGILRFYSGEQVGEK